MKVKFKQFKHEVDLVLRGIKLINEMMPSYLLLSILSALVRAVSPYCNLYFSARIIDEIAGTRNLHNIFMNVLCLVLSDFIFKILYQVLFANIRVNELIFPSWEELYLNKKSFDLKFELLENYQIREMRQKIIDNREFGGLNILLQKLLWLFRSTISIFIAVGMLPRMFVFSKTSSSAYAFSWINSPLIGVIFFVVVFIFITIMIKKNYLSREKQYEQSKKLSKAQKYSHFYIEEYLDNSGVGKDVRIYKQFELICSALKTSFDEYIEHYKGLVRYKWNADTNEKLVTNILNGFIYAFVGLKALSGALGAGSIVEYSGIMKNMIHSILNVLSIVSTIKSNNRYLEDLYSFLDLVDMENDIKEKKLRSYKKKVSAIDFKNVNFSYPFSKKDVLTDVNITINANEKIAIVGRNGSGKTTFIKLLCGLYNPTNGYIYINGENREIYDRNDYFRLFSVVFQDFKLLSFSIGQNVSASVNYNQDNVKEALIKAGLKSMIERISNVYDVSIYKNFDENGIEVSGGEAQKLAIARAFYKDSPILILDEPTASLDPISEYEIYNQISKFTENKTTIFISHRLSSCKFCDRIIVFDNGRIVQDGKHNELISDEKGVYYELWNSQAQYYVES